MNQTYLEWYEFDGNVAQLIIIATKTYKSTRVLSMNEPVYIAKFQY